MEYDLELIVLWVDRGIINKHHAVSVHMVHENGQLTSLGNSGNLLRRGKI